MSKPKPKKNNKKTTYTYEEYLRDVRPKSLGREAEHRSSPDLITIFPITTKDYGAPKNSLNAE